MLYGPFCCVCAANRGRFTLSGLWRLWHCSLVLRSLWQFFSWWQSEDAHGRLTIAYHFWPGDKSHHYFHLFHELLQSGTLRKENTFFCMEKSLRKTRSLEPPSLIFSNWSQMSSSPGYLQVCRAAPSAWSSRGVSSPTSSPHVSAWWRRHEVRFQLKSWAPSPAGELEEKIQSAQLNFTSYLWFY